MDTLELLNNFDLQVLLFFNGNGDSFFDPFMKMATNRWTWIPFYVACYAFMVMKVGWKKATICLIAAAAAVGLADFCCNTLIRKQVCRMRPTNLDNPHHVFVNIVGNYRGGKYGFPSCHAANTVALATFLTLMFRNVWFRATLWCYVVINCYSRMYLGVHYPGDILVGAVIGALIGWGLAVLVERCSGSIEQRRLVRNDAVVSLLLPAEFLATMAILSILVVI
ncbi:MAG: phosphatase PAP2 family protein [Muribaculaceae bacterium]|nr:phosphatase PAP2 family protein [Muribaculaceae bacterium]